MKVVILCGGKGTRLREETEYKPKPLVTVGGRPLLWHIMKTYSHYGFREFVLCLGYKGEMIREYFLKFEELANDCTLTLRRNGTERIVHHAPNNLEDWSITFVDTGQETMTGSRIARIRSHLNPTEPFLWTYGDGVSDVDLGKLVAFHAEHGKIATITGMHQNSRFGILEIDGDRVTSFSEKPQLEGYINGGYGVLSPKIFDYLNPDGDTVLEQTPLKTLAQQGQLGVYRHEGFFFAVDTYKDYEELNRLWERGERPWVVWPNGQR